MEQIDKLRGNRDLEGLTDLLAHPGRELRAEAARALGQLRATQAVPALIGAMADDEVDVRRAAAEALVEVGRPAIPDLLATLASQRGRAAPYALWALGEIGGPQAVDGLIACATNAPDWETRWSAVESLGRVGGLRAAAALVEALGDRDERVRTAARQAILQLEEPACEALAAGLRHPNKQIRPQARELLRQINSPAAQVWLQREQLSRWIPVVGLAIGLLLVALWLISMLVL